MVCHIAPTIQVTAGELLEACNSNPGHPVAKVYRDAVKESPPGQKLTVEKADLQALLENLRVTVETVVENGIRILRKSVKQLVAESKPPVPDPAGATQTPGPMKTNQDPARQAEPQSIQLPPAQPPKKPEGK